MTSTVRFDRWEDSAGNGVFDANGGSLARNVLYNGAMAVAQRGTSFTASANNDDVYTLDRWVLLSDGNDAVDVTQATDGPERFAYSIGLDVETANKKFGILQVLENKDSIALEGQDVTLSFYAKTTGSSLSNVKAVVLSWSSTADSVTSDVVSAWGAGGVTPTFAANWTAENTPVNLNVGSAWARYSVSATVDTASMANVAVFIWSDDDSTTVGDFLYVTGAQLEVGAVASAFEHKSYGQELAECQRYYQRFSGSSVNLCFGAAFSTTQTFHVLHFPVSMRIGPTATFLAASNYKVSNSGGSGVTCTVVSASGATENHVSLYGTVASGLSAGNGSAFQLGANSYVEFGSEL